MRTLQELRSENKSLKNKLLYLKKKDKSDYVELKDIRKRVKVMVSQIQTQIFILGFASGAAFCTLIRIILW